MKQCAPAADPGAPHDGAVPQAAPEGLIARRRRRVQILGRNHKLPALLRELRSSRSGGLDVTLMSRQPSGERQQALGELAEETDKETGELTIQHVEEDYALGASLADADPAGFDQIMLLSSGGMESSGEADARTVMGSVRLKALPAGRADPPDLIVELLDPDNAPLFSDSGASGNFS